MAASTAPASSSGLYANPREDWLAQYTEEIIDPARPIVDAREGDAKLLNGPKLDGDVGHASQDDIDALFD